MGFYLAKGYKPDIIDYGEWSITSNNMTLTWKDPGSKSEYTGKLNGKVITQGTMKSSQGYKGVWLANKID